jgi:tRNA A-37 threonylcarbamoyl transferase component Bud32
MRRFLAPWWVMLCATSFLAYFVLLVYCDIWRPGPDGIELQSSGDQIGLLVTGVSPDSPAAHAGIEKGDRVLSADGHPVTSRLEWEGVQASVRFDRPVVIEISRDQAVRRVEWVVARGDWNHWRGREGAELILARLVQLVTLGLGLIIVFRRPQDFGARIGGWLLATFGVFCITLPYRFADVWHGLPAAFGVLLWIPYVSTVLLPGLLLAFFLCFPRRVIRSVPAWVAIWAPALAIGVRQTWFETSVVYRPGTGSLPADWLGWRAGVGIGYLCAAAVVALVRFRREDPTERRRLAVMALGGGLGAVPGGFIALVFWRGTETRLFASPTVALATLALLIVPISFAYAILRHRLFDVGLIIRQGVRYAMARRLLLSIVPVLAALMALDAYWNRDRAIAEQFAARAPVYGLLSVLALVAAHRRQRWLDALDKRFFRDRYDAQRLLHSVVEDVRRSPGLLEAAPLVVERIERALYPRFVTLLAQRAEGAPYDALAATPASAGPATLAADSKLVALARLLGEPLDVSAAGETWLSDHLPSAEAEVVEKLGLELVVPIDAGRGRPAAVLTLGPRRSEEPYAEEDRQLLSTIAESLAGLDGRDRRGLASESVFGECPDCGACFDHGTATCAADGTALTTVALPRVLSSRYRLDQRLGRGGMGVVYSAADLSLARSVAVKVLREELVHDRESAGRFEREAQMSAMFTHPNVVTVHDFGVAGGSRAFLVMELLEGARLRDEIDQGPMPGPRVLSIMRGVCAAVDAAHRRHLVHRDLKPENVFLTQHDGIETPKILDFGIAKVFSGASSRAELDTAVGVMVGTPQYMAPEQLRGGAAEPSWDIWALALMACEMLTGSHPFATLALGVPGMALPSRPAWCAADSGASPAWQPYFSRWLSVDPAARPLDARGLLDELSQMLEQG